MFRFFVTLGLAIFGVIVLSSQIRVPHEVRFKNEYRREVETLRIGSAEFSNVATDEETDYVPVEAGAQEIRGRLKGMGYIFLEGKALFPPGQKKRWTVTLTTRRQFAVKEDRTRAGEQQNGQQRRAISLIRFTNNFSKRVVSVSLGPLTFRDVKPGQTTGYQPISPGVYEIVGEAEDFGPGSLRGTVIIDDKGNQRYSEVLTPGGTFILNKDL